MIQTTLAEMATRLGRADLASVSAAAAARGAEVLAEGVRERLSGRPGGSHEAPWLQSGALRGSVGVRVDAGEGGAQAVVGSSDPAAIPQEFGTSSIEPRPFLAPAAAEFGEAAAVAVAAEVFEGFGAGLRR